MSVIEQLVSAALGCDRSDIVAIIGDTDRVPQIRVNNGVSRHIDGLARRSRGGSPYSEQG